MDTQYSVRVQAEFGRKEKWFGSHEARRQWLVDSGYSPESSGVLGFSDPEGQPMRDVFDEVWKVGDVIEDSYANPSVVFSLDHRGRPSTVCQTVGSDRGHVASAPMILCRYTDPATIERARVVGRETWRKRHTSH